ncbi:MAG: OmpA family protein [Deltaproteobacteria bacterium]|nr:OmpA family protein [Deltaproteobacteria bacterium]
MALKRHTTPGAVALGLICGAPAWAQGLSVDTELLRPTFTGAELIGLERTEVGVPLQQRAGLLLQHQLAPVTLYDWNEPAGAIVSQRATAWVGLGMDLNKNTSIRGVLPTSMQWGSEVPELAASGLGTGDASLGGRWTPGGLGPLRAALRGDLILPTGRTDAWLGEEQPRLDVGVTLALRAGRTRWVAELGAMSRTTVDTGYDFVLGSTVRGAMGGAVTLRDGLSANVVLHARTGLDAFLAGGAVSSLEPIAGLHLSPDPAWAVDLGLGRGVGVGQGTSALRTLLGVTYAPPVPQAPEEVVATIPSEDRALEDQVYVEPPPAAGTWAAGQVTRVAEDRVELREQIQFAQGTDRILPQSVPVLRALTELLNEDGRIGLVVVEGHASEEGSYTYNYDLSLRRALAVQRWLVERGVHPSRLAARAMGEVMPLGADLEANRRVEFHIARWVAPGEENPRPDWAPRVPWTGEAVESAWPEPPPSPPTDLLEVSR